MSDLYKIILMVVIGGGALFAGSYMFRYLNNKITESRTGWELLLYSILLCAGCALLFFGAVAGLVYVYSFLTDAG